MAKREKFSIWGREPDTKKGCYEFFQERKKLWFELFGILILFLPFVILVLYYAVPFFELSWASSERSTSANGLPARWFVKGFLVISFFLLLISGFSRIVRIIETLRFGLEDKN